MAKCAFISAVAVLVLTGVQSVLGSILTNGPNGINSLGLGLTGDGMGIGQVEPTRLVCLELTRQVTSTHQ
jgi:hypothetical protein